MKRSDDVHKGGARTLALQLSTYLAIGIVNTLLTYALISRSHHAYCLPSRFHCFLRSRHPILVSRKRRSGLSMPIWLAENGTLRLRPHHALFLESWSADHLGRAVWHRFVACAIAGVWCHRRDGLRVKPVGSQLTGAALSVLQESIALAAAALRLCFLAHTRGHSDVPGSVRQCVSPNLLVELTPLDRIPPVSAVWRGMFDWG